MCNWTEENRSRTATEGAVSEEVVVAAPAAAVWGVYSTVELAKVCVEAMPEFISKVEVAEGDGGEGSVLKVYYAPGVPGKGYFKERFVVMDHEKRVKVTEQIEGGYLDMGFLYFRVRFEVLEMDSSTSIVRTTVEYRTADESVLVVVRAAMASLTVLAEAVGKKLEERKAKV